MAIATAYPIEFQTLPFISKKGLVIDDYQINLLTPATQLPNKNLQTVFNSINSLRSNWDGYGALEPKSEIIGIAERLLQNIPQHFVNDLTEDNIYPNPNGTITIEWTGSNDGIVSLEIGKEKSTFFASVNGEITYKNNNVVFQEDKIPSDLLSSIKEIL